MRTKTINSFVNNDLLDIIKSQFKLDIHGDHGISHWERVEKIGLYLAKETKADTEVVKLFALLHDSKRENEDKYPEHGLRAAKFAQELYEQEKLSISKHQLRLLITACRKHSNPHAKSSSITVQTCWDSDRLDLWRLGITPDAKFLYTEYAKKNKSFQIFDTDALDQRK